MDSPHVHSLKTALRRKLNVEKNKLIEWVALNNSLELGLEDSKNSEMRDHQLRMKLAK